MYLFTLARCIFRFGFVAVVVVVVVVVVEVEVEVDVIDIDVVVAVFAAFNLNLISRFSDMSDTERFWPNERANNAPKVSSCFFSFTVS